MSTYIEGALIIGIKASELSIDPDKFDEDFDKLFMEVRENETDIEIGLFGVEYEEDISNGYIGFKICEDGIIEDFKVLFDKIETVSEIAMNYLKRPKLINTFYRY